MAPNHFPEYLVQYGKGGRIGRFCPVVPLTGPCGERVVVQNQHGLYLGLLLGPATAQHQRLLAHLPVGQLLRPATADDEHMAQESRVQENILFAAFRSRAMDFGLSLEILDTELSLDGRLITLQYLGPLPPPQAWVKVMGEEFNLEIVLEDLAADPAAGGSCCCHLRGGGCQESSECASCAARTACNSSAPETWTRSHFIPLTTVYKSSHK